MLTCICTRTLHYWTSACMVTNMSGEIDLEMDSLEQGTYQSHTIIKLCCRVRQLPRHLSFMYVLSGQTSDRPSSPFSITSLHRFVPCQQIKTDGESSAFEKKILFSQQGINIQTNMLILCYWCRITDENWSL
jgi:hypothetical protein